MVAHNPTWAWDQDTGAKLVQFLLTLCRGGALGRSDAAGHSVGCPSGRRLAVPKSVSNWTLMPLREKLIKIGAKVTRHSKYMTSQLAEVAVPIKLFAAALERIKRLAMPTP